MSLSWDEIFSKKIGEKASFSVTNFAGKIWDMSHDLVDDFRERVDFIVVSSALSPEHAILKDARRRQSLTDSFRYPKTNLFER
jgi:hypothetical protein